MDPLGQSQVLPYIEDLSKKGIKFYLVSLEKIKDKEKIKELKIRLKNLGINWYKLKYFKCYSLGMALNIFQSFLLSLYLIIFKKIKIVHARAYPPLFSVLLFKKIFDLKLIFDMRGFWPEELVDSGRIEKESVYYKILKFLEKKSILLSDWIITLTPESKEIIEEKFKAKNVEWMPTCVDENKFKNQEPFSFGNKFIMVYSGSLWSFYDMPAMADFFNILKSKIKNAQFLVLGNNETERLHNLFLQKGIEERDYTIIALKPDDVAKYLLASDLAISFIYDTYSKKASFPTKIAEYLMAGLPLIINAQNNFLRELVAANKLGAVIDKFDNKSLEKAVDELLILMEDKNLKQRCKKTAQKYLGKKVCVNVYKKIYDALLELV